MLSFLDNYNMLNYHYTLLSSHNCNQIVTNNSVTHSRPNVYDWALEHFVLLLLYCTVRYWTALSTNASNTMF